MLTLNQKALQELNTDLIIPSYDRSSLIPRLVHIGCGHFHRSHFMMYLEQLLENGAADSSVIEIELMPPPGEFEENLRSQDFLYSVIEKAPDGKKTARIAGGIGGYINYKTHPGDVLDVMTADITEVISLTITEKGYCYDTVRHGLDESHPGIVHDMQHPESPVTAIGVLSLVLALRARRQAPALTILSCDNIPSNGTVLGNAIHEYCSRIFPAEAGEISRTTLFPRTMVDRITPGTGNELLQEIQTDYGYRDVCAVQCEDFKQWVIEDVPVKLLQDFRKAGAILTKDVAAYEVMKIRLLNGSHSALAYISQLLDIEDVDDAMRDPDIKSFIRNHYMEEIVRTLSPVAGIAFSEYMDSLAMRFSNRALKDSTARLACDGLKKIENAIIPPLLWLEEHGMKNEAVLLSLSFWAYYLQGHSVRGKVLLVIDEAKDTLIPLAAKSGESPEDFLSAIGLSRASKESFGKMAECFKDYVNEIASHGPRQVLEHFLAGAPSRQ